MDTLVKIFTLSKDIDEELLKTAHSLINSSVGLRNEDFELFNYAIIIKNYEECKNLEKLKKILVSSQINFEIISQSSISKTNHTKLKTNGWYEALYDVLINLNENPYLWFLNAGDYAIKESLTVVLKNVRLVKNKNVVGVGFLTQIKYRNKNFTKPDIFIEDEGDSLILSVLPCFQGVLIKAKSLKKFENLIYKGIEGIEQKILSHFFRERKMYFIPKCIAIFSYGGTSTTKEIGFKKRILNIYNFFIYRRYLKLISEICKTILNLLKLSFFNRFFINISMYRSKLIIRIVPFLKKLKLNKFIIRAHKI